MTPAFLQAAGDPSWTAVALAVLGSSALGAVIGGFGTTWLRGRIEREEAWRTRLVDAASSLAAELAEAMMAAGTFRRSLAAKDARGDDGKLSEEALELSNQLRDAWGQARTASISVQLLFGDASATYQHAFEALMWLRDQRNIAIGDLTNLVHAQHVASNDDLTSVASSCYFTAQSEFQAFVEAANAEIREARP